MDVLPKGVRVENDHGMCAVWVSLPGCTMDSAGHTDDICVWEMEPGEDKAIGKTIGTLYAIAWRARVVADALRERQRSG